MKPTEVQPMNQFESEPEIGTAEELKQMLRENGMLTLDGTESEPAVQGIDHEFVPLQHINVDRCQFYDHGILCGARKDDHQKAVQGKEDEENLPPLDVTAEDIESAKTLRIDPALQPDSLTDIMGWWVKLFLWFGGAVRCRERQLSQALAELRKLRSQETPQEAWIPVPDSQGWWWYFYDGAAVPYPYGILWSGAANRYFIQYPDSRWCDEIGGLWLKAKIPSAPSVQTQGDSK